VTSTLLKIARPAATVVGLALVAAFPALPAQAGKGVSEEPCQPTVLSAPAGMTNNVLQAVDSSGRWQLGQAQDADGNEYLIRWDNGTALDLGASTADVWIGGTAINRDGTVIGAGGADVSTSWVYRDGRFSKLPGIRGADEVYSFDINDGGTVVGRANEAVSGLEKPVRWSPAGTVTALPLLQGDNYGQVESVDSDGTAVGIAGFDARDTTTLTRKVVAWTPDGSIHALPVPDDAPDADINLVAIRGGVIVGDQPIAGGKRRVLVWDSVTAAPRVLTDGTAKAVSGDGGSIVLRDDGLWLLRDGVRHELADPSTDQVMAPTDIAGVTNAGVIYGLRYAYENPEPYISYRWDCSRS
jgi:hypothetical protein